MARLVRDLMTTRVVSVRPDELVATAVDRMTRYGFSALPVVSGAGRLVGMVSLLDVLRHREDNADDPSTDDHVRVAEIMATDVLSMSATANATVVAQRLRDHGDLRVLPVVQGGRLVGVATRGDLLRARERDGGARRGWFRRRDRAEDDAMMAMARPRRTGPRPSADAPLRAVMTTAVVTVGPHEPVGVAATLMLRDRHTALPVVDAAGVLVGIVSEADLLSDPLAGRVEHATVGRVMSRSPITVAAGSTVGAARTLVADRGLRTVPVVEGGRLVGVVSRSDLI